MTAARLHVMTATENTRAVILRRGPTRHVASLLWNRATDEITLGQWLHGRIYEHRSDLSPDGRHMIYFAGTSASIREGRWHTVVSRAPWFRAIVFLPQEWTWHGGGAFTADGRVFLNGGGTLPKNEDGLLPAPPDAYPHGTDGFHMGGLYAAMMARRGWRHTAGDRYETVLETALPDGWTLELFFRIGTRNRSIVSNAYALTHPVHGRHPMEGWEWAEPWKNGLQFAKAGALHEAAITKTGLDAARQIADLTPMTFENIKAPYDG